MWDVSGGCSRAATGHYILGATRGSLRDLVLNNLSNLSIYLRGLSRIKCRAHEKTSLSSVTTQVVIQEEGPVRCWLANAVVVEGHQPVRVAIVAMMAVRREASPSIPFALFPIRQLAFFMIQSFTPWPVGMASVLALGRVWPSSRRWSKSWFRDAKVEPHTLQRLGKGEDLRDRQDEEALQEEGPRPEGRPRQMEEVLEGGEWSGVSVAVGNGTWQISEVADGSGHLFEGGARRWLSSEAVDGRAVEVEDEEVGKVKIWAVGWDYCERSNSEDGRAVEVEDDKVEIWAVG